MIAIFFYLSSIGILAVILRYITPNIELYKQLIKTSNIYATKFLLLRGKATIGKSSHVYGYQHIGNSGKDLSNLHIGEQCSIGSNCYFDLVEKIIIQDKATISSNVRFITHQDMGRSDLSLSYPRETGKIIIGTNSYIGDSVIILAGIIIGENCIIGAGAVVTEDIPPNSLAVGVPARVIRKLNINETHETV